MDFPNLDAAVQWAARIPSAALDAVIEVRTLAASCCAVGTVN